MAKYQFTTVVKEIEQHFKAITKGPGPGGKDVTIDPPAEEKRAHDLESYKALRKPFGEVKSFYDEYTKFMAEAKTQAKNNMDAIETTLKKCKGKPDATAMKLLKQSHDLILDVASACNDYQRHIRDELLDWRGGWTGTARGALFNLTLLETMTAARQHYIDLQAKDWNPTNERIAAYVARATTLLKGVETAAAGKGASAEGLLKTLAQELEQVRNTGSKGLGSIIEAVTTSNQKAKVDAKSGALAKAMADPAVRKLQVQKLSQLEAYGKTLRGTDKTLGIMLDNIAKAAKSVAKDDVAQLAVVKKEIETLRKQVAGGISSQEEAVKIVTKAMAQKAK